MSMEPILGIAKFFPFFLSSSFFLIIYPRRYTQPNSIYIIFKCIPILSLALFVLFNLKKTENPDYLIRIFFGLVISAIADAVICSEKYFLVAVGLFALVHIIYLSSFGFRPFRLRIFLIIALIETCCFFYLIPFIKNYLLKYILTRYVTLLFMMIWRSISQINFYTGYNDWSKISGALGSILFGISDITLCYSMYAQNLEFGNLIIMSTYYYAQAGIAFSVLSSKEKV
ncbi:unnamed protein product [Brachionus calyciflorus]|uniref:lysoplasmalogenase n=1 Tax=Brachionus calyciflorus TaxID=104777 RepID=A0A813UJD9_9BILA|nr:unnamed protein product [Brachionus calyciflorus]